MIFNKDLKICLFQPPKTGTTTARKCMSKIKWNVIFPYHGTPDECLKLYPNLKNYKCYAFFRNPVERFISTAKYLIKFSKGKENTNPYKYLMSNFDELFEKENWLLRPQSLWVFHPLVKALDFRNYETELKRIANLSDLEITLENKSGNVTYPVPDSLFNFVQSKYKDDCVFWKEKFS